MRLLKQKRVFPAIVLIICLFFQGCASRKVIFTSKHDTIVKVGSKHCVTPCTMNINNDIAEASAFSQNNVEETIFLPEPPGKWKKTKQNLYRVTGAILVVLAIPLYIVGLIGISASVDSDDSISANDVSSDNDTSELQLIGLGSLLSGYVFFELGEYLLDEGKDRGQPIHIDFAPVERDTLNDGSPRSVSGN